VHWGETTPHGETRSVRQHARRKQPFAYLGICQANSINKLGDDVVRGHGFSRTIAIINIDKV
jgi:hypothetical protein